MKRPHDAEPSRKVREFARRPGVRFRISGHGRRELRKDDIDLTDAYHVIKAGFLVRAELHGEEWRYTLQGHTVDGDSIQIVVALHEEQDRIDVITGWKLKA